MDPHDQNPDFVEGSSIEVGKDAGRDRSRAAFSSATPIDPALIERVNTSFSGIEASVANYCGEFPNFQRKDNLLILRDSSLPKRLEVIKDEDVIGVGAEVSTALARKSKILNILQYTGQGLRELFYGLRNSILKTTGTLFVLAVPILTLVIFFASVQDDSLYALLPIVVTAVFMALARFLGAIRTWHMALGIGACAIVFAVMMARSDLVEDQWYENTKREAPKGLCFPGKKYGSSSGSDSDDANYRLCTPGDAAQLWLMLLLLVATPLPACFSVLRLIRLIALKEHETVPGDPNVKFVNVYVDHLVLDNTAMATFFGAFRNRPAAVVLRRKRSWFLMDLASAAQVINSFVPAASINKVELSRTLKDSRANKTEE